MADFKEVLLPLLIAKDPGPNSLNPFEIDRYAGVGFFASPMEIVTCAHVVQMAQAGEVVLAHDQITNEFIKVDFRCHPKFDFAAGLLFNRTDRRGYPLASKRFFPGAEVGAFGFTASGKEGNVVKTDVHYSRGYLVRVDDAPVKPDARSTMEISFPAPKGFSGAPLVSVGHNSEVVGMLFSNYESRRQIDRITEIQDGNSKYEEIVHRTVEFGLAHSSLDIIEFLKYFHENPLA